MGFAPALCVYYSTVYSSIIARVLVAAAGFLFGVYYSVCFYVLCVGVCFVCRCQVPGSGFVFVCVSRGGYTLHLHNNSNILL